MTLDGNKANKKPARKRRPSSTLNALALGESQQSSGAEALGSTKNSSNTSTTSTTPVASAASSMASCSGGSTSVDEADPVQTRRQLSDGSLPREDSRSSHLDDNHSSVTTTSSASASPRRDLNDDDDDDDDDDDSTAIVSSHGGVHFEAEDIRSRLVSAPDLSQFRSSLPTSKSTPQLDSLHSLNHAPNTARPSTPEPSSHSRRRSIGLFRRRRTNKSTNLYSQGRYSGTVGTLPSRTLGTAVSSSPQQAQSSPPDRKRTSRKGKSMFPLEESRGSSSSGSGSKLFPLKGDTSEEEAVPPPARTSVPPLDSEHHNPYLWNVLQKLGVHVLYWLRSPKSLEAAEAREKFYSCISKDPRQLRNHVATTVAALASAVENPWPRVEQEQQPPSAGDTRPGSTPPLTKKTLVVTEDDVIQFFLEYFSSHGITVSPSPMWQRRRKDDEGTSRRSSRSAKQGSKSQSSKNGSAHKNQSLKIKQKDDKKKKREKKKAAQQSSDATPDSTAAAAPSSAQKDDTKKKKKCTDSDSDQKAGTDCSTTAAVSSPDDEEEEEDNDDAGGSGAGAVSEGAPSDDGEEGASPTRVCIVDAAEPFAAQDRARGRGKPNHSADSFFKVKLSSRQDTLLATSENAVVAAASEARADESASSGSELNGVTLPSCLPAPGEPFYTEILIWHALELFNRKPAKGMDRLCDLGVVARGVEEISEFLHGCPLLDPRQVGEYLGQEDPMVLQILARFVALVNFRNLDFDLSLRRFLCTFHLPGEAQKIDRIMQEFGRQFFAQNPGSVFRSSKAVHALAFSAMMLNTDLHNINIRVKMTREQFVRNNDGINVPDNLAGNLVGAGTGAGSSKKDDEQNNLPQVFLHDLYFRIASEEIKLTRESVRFPNAVRKGYLHYRFKTKKAWKRRWFILSDNRLYAFKNAADLLSEMEVLLESVLITPLTREEARGRKHCCLVRGRPSRRGPPSTLKVKGLKGAFTSPNALFLSATTAKDVMLWMKALDSQVAISDTPDDEDFGAPLVKSQSAYL